MITKILNKKYKFKSRTNLKLTSTEEILQKLKKDN